MFSKKQPSTLAAKLKSADGKAYDNMDRVSAHLEQIKRLVTLIKTGNYNSEHHDRSSGTDLNKALETKLDAFKDARYQLQFSTEQFCAAFKEMKEGSDDYVDGQANLGMLIDQMKALINKVKPVQAMMEAHLADSKQSYQPPNAENYKQGIKYLKKQVELCEKFVADNEKLIPKQVAVKHHAVVPPASKSSGPRK